MFILLGNDTPELFMIYLKNYDDKIHKNLSLIALEKLADLKQIVDKEAQTILSKVEASFEVYSEPDDIEKIHNHRIRNDIITQYNTGDKISIYFAGTGNTVYKKRRIKHMF